MASVIQILYRKQMVSMSRKGKLNIYELVAPPEFYKKLEDKLRDDFLEEKVE